MKSTRHLSKAISAKNDEFYTTLPDIEKELRHYEHHFEGKVVFCNCDDPRTSNFFQYFSFNFERLGIKKLIVACYKNQNRNLFDQRDAEPAIYLEHEGSRAADNAHHLERTSIKQFDGDGDFRSKESIDLLKQSDVVVTNPPFSLFREYVAQLTKYDKKFLIVGTWYAIAYKEIFPLIKANKLWMGMNSNRDFSGFIVPKHYSLHGAETKIDESGDRLVSTNNTCWFTNIDNDSRHEEFILHQEYNPEKYPFYDNYDAIDVSRTNNIPADYNGIMGVPVTFMNKYNPSQFEIVGCNRGIGQDPDGVYGRSSYLNGKETFQRLFIRHRKL